LNLRLRRNDGIHSHGDDLTRFLQSTDGAT
jgi:hypothetical protein